MKNITITDAAIKVIYKNNQQVFHCPESNCHHDILQCLYKHKGITKEKINDGLVYEQGFLTNEKKFVDRIEAKKIAKKTGQLLVYKELSKF